MIRKLGRFDAPIPVVRNMFRQTEDWPRWMPGIASTRTLSSTDSSRLVEVVHLVRGRRFVQHLECRDVGSGLEHRQQTGFFKTWNAAWSFQKPPDGEGTTVALSLELEVGITAGLLIPKRLLQSWIGGMLDETIASGQKQAIGLAGRQREPTQVVHVGKPMLQVFEVPNGFEVVFAGRTFVIDAQNPPREQ